ncbi:MAG: threonine synthase, partial [Bacteroidota bacterium]
MQFYSTNNKSQLVSFKEAVKKGLPEDNGLFMPAVIPQLPKEFFDSLDTLSIPEIGYEILKPFVSEDVPDVVLKDICHDAFSFELPLVNVDENINVLELYHGPTLAFKDFGARFMARVLGYFNAENNSKNTILVATSGDTGSAVASGFYEVENVEVVILYPEGKISDLQEKQMTTLGKNIHAVAIDGTFDDCQRLVKAAFLDQELSSKYGLTSANSINIARLLPQMVYYFYAWSRLADKSKPIVFSVPSGNFGNLTAGMIARKMGLPIDHFIAATNVNDIVPEYLESGNFNPRPSIETISNAMDVGNPSNFVRLQEIFNQSLDQFNKELTGYHYSDDETRETIKEVYTDKEYILDPHGAIGYRALQAYLKLNDVTGVVLETAHPIKFGEVVEPLIDKQLTLPESLKSVMELEKQREYCSSGFVNFNA